MRAVKDHIESEFGTVSRGKKHTTPAKEKDIKTLCAAYEEEEIHAHVPKRIIKRTRDRASDYIGKGVKEIREGKVIQRWWNNRATRRETVELWEIDMDSSNSSCSDLENEGVESEK